MIISALDRKLIRDLRSSGIIVLAIAGIIAVGVACFVTMRSAYQNLGEGQERYYAECRMADFSVELKKAPISVVDQIGAIPGVATVRSRLQFFVTVDLQTEPSIINGQVISMPSHHQPVLNDLVMKHGGYFTGISSEEVIVNDAFARAHSLEPGDTIHLLLNDRRQAFQIVGTAISSEFVYLLGPGAIVPDPAHFGVFYLPRESMEAAFGFEGACNQLLGKLNAVSSETVVDTVLERTEAILDDYGVGTTIPLRDQLSNRFLSDEIEGLGTFAFVMPMIFLGVASLVLAILMGRLAEQQRTTIGTLKAIGYSNLQLTLHFLKFGIAVGLLGGAIGDLLGYLMGGGLTNLYRSFFELPSLTNRVFPEVFAIGLVISLLCATLGAAQGVRGVLRLEPAEAMRPKPPSSGKATWPERIGWLWSLLDTNWRMVIRNILRNPGRNLIGLISMALAASLLTMGFMSRSAIEVGIDVQFNQIQRSDLELTLRDTKGRDALIEAAGLPGVDHAEAVFTVACRFQNGPIEKRGAIVGIGSNARLTRPQDTKQHPIELPDVGIALGKGMAEHLGAKRGDLVIIEPIEGHREPRTVPVTAIVDSFIGLSSYAEIDYLSKLMDESFAVNGLQLEVNPDPELRRRLLVALKARPAIQAASIREEIIEHITTTFLDSNRATTTIMVFFAGTIFFGTTLNASLVGLAERRREVATLLVLGFERGEVSRLFLSESLLINSIGTLLGLRLGQWMFQALIESYQTDVFRIPVVDPGSAFGWTILVGLTFCLGAHGVVARAIRRLDLQESMRIRE